VSFVDLFLQFSLFDRSVGVANRGVSFGIGQSVAVNIKYVVLCLIAVLGYVLFFVKKGLSLPLLALFAGGVVNLAVRFYLGFVWDYIRIPVVNVWVNLSDLLISLGAVSYILVGDGDTDTQRDS